MLTIVRFSSTLAGSAVRRLLPLLALVSALVFSAVAGASAQQREIHLGLYGDPGPFASVTGQQPEVSHVFVNFRQGHELAGIIAKAGPVPMVALIPGAYHTATATPEGIAKGKNDQFLFKLNGVIAAYPGSLFYLRPFPEMNGHWETNCAYNEDGTLRPSYDSTAWSRKALARIAVITRGGTAADINAKLARLHLPRIHRGDLPVTTPKLQIVWNPQGFGSPDVPGNSANAYYPGNAYVDIVADDLYDMAGHGATWAAAQKLYDSHPSKPFGFGEWGLWGIDDPSFVREMGTFARAHRRLVLLAWFNGRPGSIFDLHSKPHSAAAYRKYISSLG